MGSSFFHEFKKQASFFLKENIRMAKLSFTDVTRAQLFTEEATNGNPGAPDTIILKVISRAAFEIDDFWRITEILHKRFLSFDRKNWWASYKALILLEHLLTHGPVSISEEFQSDIDVITEIGKFQYVDEKGFNWGLTVRKKSDRVLELLYDRTFHKEERDRARTVTNEILGFGSFQIRTKTTTDESEHTVKTFDKCNSQFNEHGNQDHTFSILNNLYSSGSSKQQQQGRSNEEMESLISLDKFSEDFDDWEDSSDTEESELLLHGERNRNRNRNMNMISSISLHSTAADRILQAC